MNQSTTWPTKNDAWVIVAIADKVVTVTDCHGDGDPIVRHRWEHETRIGAELNYERSVTTKLLASP